MAGWIIGAVVAAFVVAGLLLSESDGSGKKGSAVDGVASIFGVLLAIAVLALVWGGGVAWFVGCVCLVLKLLGVEPVASWTWFQAFLPLVGGFVAQITGLVVREALD